MLKGYVICWCLRAQGLLEVKGLWKAIELGLDDDITKWSWCLRAQGLLEVKGLWKAIELGLDDDITKWSSQDKEIDHKTKNLRVENDDLTLSKLKSKLLEEERRIRGSNEEKIQAETKAYAAKSTKYFKWKPQRGSDEKKPNRESKSYENLRCYRCLEFGENPHWQILYCKGDNKQKEPDGQPKIAFQAMMRVNSEAYLTNDPYFKTDRNLKLDFWAEAIMTACYIRNRCPQQKPLPPTGANEGVAPIARWKNGANTIDYRVFGCKAWAANKFRLSKSRWKNGANTIDYRVFGCKAWAANKFRLSKLSPKGMPCIFIGFDENVKAYRFYDDAKDTFFISRDVKFAEDVFPMRQQDRFYDDAKDTFFISRDVKFAEDVFPMRQQEDC
ncbi:hypothetical protein QE152_g9065 [Popillia japonica]|uniref:Retroviral polymerase SH3-like domain-containing protein n=1 Tax=Popillia japonica TaxID=7064 RepID=A0AAW1LVQ9_POPJA